VSNRELSAYLDIQYIIIMRIKKCYGFMIHGSYTNLFIFYIHANEEFSYSY
jgi:hypothetical protein